MNADILEKTIFADADRAHWLKLVDKALKGARFSETLVSATDDGIAIDPLYAPAAHAAPLLRRRPDRPWTITQRMDDPDLDRAFWQLAEDLEQGATGIDLVFGKSGSAFGLGLAETPALADRLAVALGGKPLSLRLDGASPAFAEALSAALAAKPLGALHLGLDTLASPGDAVTDLARRFRRLEGGATTLLNADGRPVHNAGGTEAQELGVVAAALCEHLRALDASGIAPGKVLSATSLCLSADQDQFVSIAKVRAIRLIFARIAEACGSSNTIAANLFLETSYRMLTWRDPESNLLRNTIAVFAAGVGSADEIAVLPHTLPHGVPEELARRLARNTQTILIAESRLDHVGDPSAGSGGIEALTDALAEKAWGIFTDIERSGGLQPFIASGGLEAMIAEARKNRPPELIVGTSLFPAKHERPVAVTSGLGPIAGAMGLNPTRLDESLGVST